MSIWNFLKGKNKEEPPVELPEEQEPTEFRGAERVSMYRDSRVHYISGGSDACIINNVSQTGMRISCQMARSFPETVRIMYGGERRLCKVVWVSGITAGLQFIDDQ